MKERILQLLKNGEGEFISGEEISKKIGMSRAAVWKYINVIKGEGYEIEAVSRKGYRIISSPDLLTEEELRPYLKAKFIGRKIIHFESIDSTNSKAKELSNYNENHGTVVIGEEQSNGRGRLGRSWVSPKYKGIWMSIILRPDINPLNVARLTLVGAVAVSKALTEMNIKSKVKWPNDIMINGKKLCGILTEMSAELNLVNYVVMGIGINVNSEEKDFPIEIRNIATSLKEILNKEINRKELTARVLNNFEELYERFVKEEDLKECIEICKRDSLLIGKEVILIQRGEEIKATALDIDNEGALVVEYKDGSVKKIVSGEISMRGIDQN